MKLTTTLTSGWHDASKAPHAAYHLHQHACQTSDNYTEALKSALKRLPKTQKIIGLEQLFRRRTHGYDNLKRFIGTLVSLPPDESNPAPLICHIDAFAYAFLAGAKNMDLLLPLATEANTAFHATLKEWQQAIKALEDFERLGQALPEDSTVNAEHYLAVRRVVARPSARDERNTLASLLLSGPSTLEDIREDLGLNYSLGQRTLAAFESVGLVERRSDKVFAITETLLPLAVFCLRETLGLDPLATLQNLLGESHG